MKFIVAVILTALLGFLGGLYLPWWSIALAAFAVALMIRQRPLMAWLAGFAGIFLLWSLLAWWIDMKNESILSSKIAVIIPLGGSSLALILVSALAGALVAGVAALSGSYLVQGKPAEEETV